MKKTVGLFLLFFCSSLFAISPQFWEKNTQQQFAEGDPQSVSINSDGEVVLAPQLKVYYEGSDPIIWKIRADTVGNIYLATGNEGKIIKIDTFGKSSVYLDTNELEVQAMVLDPNNYLYAATSPDGKIYKIRADGTSTVFFDPDDKYIWSLALDNAGNLYAGTGDQGKIYKIDPQGKGTVLVDTNENNITALQWANDGKLLAGSDRNGILYSVDSTGKAFVLFDSDLQQITSIFSTPSGDTYFSAITGIVPAPGNRPVQEVTRPVQGSSATGESESEFGSDETEVVASVDVSVSTAVPTTTQTPPRQTGASQLYRISPEGFTELIYNAAEDQILDISGFRDDMILLSTGKKAKLISVDQNKKSTILLKAPEEQLTSLLMTGDKMWVATANPGNVYQLVENHSASGVYYSDVKDTQTTSTWGQISWKADVPEGTTLSISTRSGNTRTPDDTWSNWYNAGVNPEGSKIQNPRSRFIQWKAEFSTTNPILSPVLRSVSLAYLQQNIRPEVHTINIHPPGIVYRRTPVYTQESFAGLEEAPSDRDQPDTPGQSQQGFEFGGGLGKREIRKGYQTITWSAYDQNQDELRYDLAYRSDTDRNWRVLQKNLKDRVYAWDTQTLPDGTYTIKVTANDSGSNPKEYVLSNSKESTPFDIDNSAPSIEVKSSIYEKGRFILEVRATDRFSAIRDMQYSIAPGEWVVVFPIDSINDSPSEDYRIELVNLPIEVNTIILRCTDRVRNAMTVKHALTR